MAEEEEHKQKLTTEEEVRELSIKNTRNLYQLLITKSSKEIKQQKKFQDRDSHFGTEGLIEHRSYKDSNYELKYQIQDIGIQSSSMTKENQGQTRWIRQVNSNTQSKYLSLTDEEKQKILQSDEFLEFVHKVTDRVSPILTSNYLTNLFEDELKGIKAIDITLVKSFSITQLQESFILKDARFNYKINYIDWMPNHDNVLGVSFSRVNEYEEYLNERSKGSIEYIFIWNFESILHPQYILETPSIVNIFKFHPQLENIIICGCFNGQILLFDLNDKNTLVNQELRNNYSTEDSFSQIYHSKYSSFLILATNLSTKNSTEIITDLQWIENQQRITRIGEIETNETITEFITLSMDGRLIIWDINFENNHIHSNVELYLPGSSLINEWTPIFTMNLYKSQQNNILIPSKYFQLKVNKKEEITGDINVITDEGEIIIFNWLNGQDRTILGRQNPQILKRTQILYHSAINFIISPFLKKFYLCCDQSYIVLIYLSKNIEELYRSSIRNSNITCGIFSPSRPSIFYIGKENGEVEIWSLLDKSYECLFTQSLSSHKITYLSFNNNKQDLLSVGCNDGSIIIYKIPEFLLNKLPNEENNLKDFIKQQRNYYNQTENRFSIRNSNNDNKNKDEKDQNVEQENKENQNEEEDEADDKIDQELVQFEREYSKICKEFEILEKEQFNY